MRWINDQDGNPSVIVTLVTVSFAVTTVAYVLSLVGHVGTHTFQQFDPASAGAYFGSILAAYVGHRWVDSRATPTPAPAPVAVADNQPLPPTGG